MKTNNVYQYPVKKARITYDKSPAHTGRLQFAVDFIIPEGTPIKASFDGIVVDVKQDSDIGGPDKSFDKFGNYIEIEHPNGEYSIYEHIGKEEALVKKGDRVKTGQIIGYSGNTGWMAQLGPHLHFDVHKYYEPFGPEDYETLEIRWKNSRGRRLR
jgi:murein DD-endopeptidase MepM/ murein hydrolase activator NlpD